MFAIVLMIGLMPVSALATNEVVPETQPIATDNSPAQDSTKTFPETFDLRTSLGESRVTPIVNQGSYEICGAYAAIATLETSLLTGGFAPMQLSPKHAAYFEDKGFEEGEAQFGMDEPDWSTDGIAGMAPAEIAASLAAGKGAVLMTPETDGDLAFDESWRFQRDVTLTETTFLARQTSIDYGDQGPVGSPAPAYEGAPMGDDSDSDGETGDDSNYDPTTGDDSDASTIEVRDIPTFWEVTGVDDDRESAVKSLLMEGHAVTVIVNAGIFQTPDDNVVNPLNEETCSFYTPVDAKGFGDSHYLAIIGWDDGYSRENFNL